MSDLVKNYDGSIESRPQRLVYPESVDEIRLILANVRDFPGPVRAMGSNHSVTPCASSDGTIVNMSRMNRILEIDRTNMTLTAQAGTHLLDAAKTLRAQGLQLFTNVEIGNATLGAAACCHIKDGLDGVEFGQLSSYVTAVKWVTPAGDLAHASEADRPEVLHFVRSSHGLCGIIYEVTLRIKPLQPIRLTYLPRPLQQLTQAEVNNIVGHSQALMCWILGDTAIFQTRRDAAKVGPAGSLFAAARRKIWTHAGPFTARFIDLHVPTQPLRNVGHALWFAGFRATYAALHRLGGASLYNPDKIMDYSRTPPRSRFSFSFWAFPAGQWLETVREYRAFADEYFKKHGFRCNCPLVTYHIPKDTSSILSYTRDGDVLTIDPIHAYSDKEAWHRYLHAFNEFGHRKNGIPLLNQTPLLERRHLSAAYGDRWRQFSDWVRSEDPTGRMLNPFFAELLDCRPPN